MMTNKPGDAKASESKHMPAISSIHGRTAVKAGNNNGERIL